MDIERIMLIEKFLTEEPLSVEEGKKLNELSLQQSFFDDVQLIQDFLGVVNIWGKEELKNRMNLWKKEMDFPKGKPASKDAKSQDFYKSAPMRSFKKKEE